MCSMMARLHAQFQILRHTLAAWRAHRIWGPVNCWHQNFRLGGILISLAARMHLHPIRNFLTVSTNQCTLSMLDVCHLLQEVLYITRSCRRVHKNRSRPPRLRRCPTHFHLMHPKPRVQIDASFPNCRRKMIRTVGSGAFFFR